MTTHIKHRWKLLQQIADNLNAHSNVRVANLTVVLKTDTDSFEFELALALDLIVNDIWWDERGDWSEAHTATVESF